MTNQAERHLRCEAPLGRHIHRHLLELEHCALLASRQVPLSSGAATLTLHVATDGSVAGVDLSGEGLDPDVARCIRAHARQWSFASAAPARPTEVPFRLSWTVH